MSEGVNGGTANTERVRVEAVDEGKMSVKRKNLEDDGYTEECDAGMGEMDEVVGELGGGPSEEVEATVS